MRFQVERRQVLNSKLVADRGLKTAPEVLEPFLSLHAYDHLAPDPESCRKNHAGHVATEEKARAIYNYVVGNVKYDKTIPGLGQRRYGTSL